MSTAWSENREAEASPPETGISKMADLEDTPDLEDMELDSRFELALYKAKNLASALEDAANLDILSVPTETSSSGFSSKTTLVREIRRILVDRP